MLAAAAAPLDSADSAVVAAVLREAVVPVDLLPALVDLAQGLADLRPLRVQVDLAPGLADLRPLHEQAVLALVAPEPLRRHRLQLPLPPVVVGSEAPLRLQGHRLCSAAMAMSSPPTGKPTYARAPSTR